ncbi:PEP-CTERM sorting domain-containing protein [Duganella sp. HH105]|uniref:PEP-CTERM sorting domain-containing protein n=1 Tax=Duganella sp. HH105 TaxID=1781067 RepID=UPI000892C26F|nr:PEP-CTERM sorting domain-containing protein [Duganella sp. HH105]OEZ55654.1 PEP-CTERM motif protein [Duganella sp. HH105]
MTVKSALKAGVLVGLLGLALQAQAATILMNFDGVTSNYEVAQFYNGGTDGAGASGVNYGVSYHDIAATNGAFGQTSLPNLAYNSGAFAVADVAAGFTSLTFTSGAFSTAYMDVYSDLGGNGTLLGSVQLGSDPFAFSSTSVTFSGIAKSFMLRGGEGQAGIDDVQITTVPEPETYGMLLAGLALVGVAARRKQRA